MFRDLVQILFCLLFAVLMTASLFFPQFLSDQGNQFLQEFMDIDILAVLGFITALSNASILSIFLHLNYLDDEVMFSGKRVRGSLKLSAVSQSYGLLLSWVGVIIKPIIPQEVHLIAVLNSIGILCVVFSLSVLRDISLTVAKIPTKRKIRELQKKNAMSGPQ